MSQAFSFSWVGLQGECCDAEQMEVFLLDVAVFAADNCSPNCSYSMYTSFTSAIPNAENFPRMA